MNDLDIVAVGIEHPSVLAFVTCKVCDPKWLKGLGVKSDCTLEITDCDVFQTWGKLTRGQGIGESQRISAVAARFGCQGA